MTTPIECAEQIETWWTKNQACDCEDCFRNLAQLAPEAVKNIREQRDTIERLTHGIHETARDLYAVEINQQSLGRTDENGARLRKAQAALVELHDSDNDPRERWNRYIARLEQRLDDAGLLKQFREELHNEAIEKMKASGNW